MQPVQSDYSIYREVINQLMADNESLPSLPTITLDIRRAIAQADISFVTLSKIIAKDPSLAAILLKYASSPLVCHGYPPQNLLDVVRVLGINQVGRITMAHSVKSLFTIHSAQHKQLYIEAWRRIALKASVSTYIAKQLGKVSPDHVMLGAILSEVGSLAVLSAFKKGQKIPELPVYISLCREYSKSLGVIMLTKWLVDKEYISVARQAGNWLADSPGELNLNDIINLGLYHSLRLRHLGKNLPPLELTAAYQKIPFPQNVLSATGELAMVISHKEDIRELARSLFKE